MRDHQVLEAQQHLSAIGWNVARDGDLGPQTRQAVSDFQTAWNPGDNPAGWIGVDGKPGPQTLNALRASVYLGGLVSLTSEPESLPVAVGSVIVGQPWRRARPAGWPRLDGNVGAAPVDR